MGKGYELLNALLLLLISTLLGILIRLLISQAKKLREELAELRQEVQGAKVQIHNFMVATFTLMQRLHPGSPDVSETMRDVLTIRANGTGKANGAAAGGE